MWGLVTGCVRARSGPEEKLKGLSAAFSELGCDIRLELVRPDRSGARRMAALLHELASDPPPEPGLVLLRSHWSLPTSLPTLRRLRASGHVVVIDVPTPIYVGVREIRQAPRPPWERAGRLLAETVWTPSAWPVADLLVQYAPDSAPWGWLAAKRRLTLTNGVDVASRPVTSAWVGRTGVTFICVGALGPWHGLDRLVRGMAAVTDPPSQLLVVGEGPEQPRLRALAQAVGVADRVHFLGPMEGSALDAIVNEADVGVASLAEHRRGAAALSPLKTRDYLARGLPVVFAGQDPDLRDDPPFTLRLADDDSGVDIQTVIEWLGGLRARAHQAIEPTGVAVSPIAIRAFASRNLQWRTRAEAILAAVADSSTR